MLLDAARRFPAVVVTRPRRAGKTTLLLKLFPKAQYVLLEDTAIARGVEALDLENFVSALLQTR